MTEPDIEQITLALQQREGEVIEIVSMPAARGSSPTVARAFAPSTDLSAAVAWATEQARRPDRTVSMSIGSLSTAAAERINTGKWLRANSTRAAEEGIDLLEGYAWIAADVDPDKTRPEAGLMARLLPLPRPTMLVHSGSGLHAWWQLTGLLSVDNARELLDAVCRACDGDRGALQPTRALRLPGTFNSKPTARRHARIIGGTGELIAAHDLLTAAYDVAPPPPPPVVPVRAPRSSSYDGPDLRERARSRHDLVALLDEICGPPNRAGDWSCFAHEDRTPSLRLVQGSTDAAVCYGGGHPDGIGMRKDGYAVLDCFDVLAWQWGVDTARVVSDLVAEERRREQAVTGPAVGMPGLVALLDTATQERA